MRHKRKGPAESMAGTEIRILCYTCNRETMHLVVRSAEYENEWRDDGDAFYASDSYQVIECRGCQSLGFVHLHTDSEDLEPDPEGSDSYIASEKQTLYPSRVAGRSELQDTWALPSQVSSIYRETVAALRANLLVLTGIGIRAIVETVCKERNAAGRDLENKIEALVTQGVLTNDGAKILHGLRILGNQAAHEVKPQTLDTLNVALDVVDHLLLGVYVLPDRAKKLPKKGTT